LHKREIRVVKTGTMHTLDHVEVELESEV
jgi:hypothetical protein